MVLVVSGYALRANPTYPTCVAHVLARMAWSSRLRACRTLSSGMSSKLSPTYHSTTLCPGRAAWLARPNSQMPCFSAS